jgi:hypothetical protein
MLNEVTGWEDQGNFQGDRSRRPEQRMFSFVVLMYLLGTPATTELQALLGRVSSGR